MTIINDHFDNKESTIRNNGQQFKKFDEKNAIQNSETTQESFNLELTPSQSLIKLIDELTTQTPNCWEARIRPFKIQNKK